MSAWKVLVRDVTVRFGDEDDSPTEWGVELVAPDGSSTVVCVSDGLAEASAVAAALQAVLTPGVKRASLILARDAVVSLIPAVPGSSGVAGVAGGADGSAA